jgi:predicted dehydrogenase
MSRRRTGVGIVGVGVISAEYVRTLQSAPDLEVRFLAARQPSRARARAEELGVPAFGTYDELLRDASIEVVVNLTVPQVHAEITEQALDSGRHVYSEKPLALAGGDGRRLVDLAASRGLRLGCAPDTFLGAGLQTALRTIRSGEIGTPRSAFANFQYGGPNLWHPNPEFLFQPGGGPLFDIGPYHLTALVQVFGAVARVSAQAIAGAATPGHRRRSTGGGGLRGRGAHPRGRVVRVRARRRRRCRAQLRLPDQPSRPGGLRY